jgi:hypothetical protein
VAFETGLHIIVLSKYIFVNKNFLDYIGKFIRIFCFFDEHGGERGRGRALRRRYTVPGAGFACPAASSYIPPGDRIPPAGGFSG